MMKRSPDESFVFTPSKQPRQGPSAGPQSISELARNIPDKRIKAMHAYLQVWVETPDDDIDFASVHGIVQLSLPTRTPPRFVDLTTFEKNMMGVLLKHFRPMNSTWRCSPLYVQYRRRSLYCILYIERHIGHSCI